MEGASRVVPCKVCVELRLAVGWAVCSPSKLPVFAVGCPVDAGTPQGEQADGLGWHEEAKSRTVHLYITVRGWGACGTHLQREGGGVGLVVHSWSV